MVDWALTGLVLLGFGHPVDLDPDDGARRRAAVRARFGQGPEHPLGPGLEVISTPRFLWVEDQARTLPAAPWTTDGAWAEAFEMARTAWAAREPDHATALVIVATFEAGDRELFYVPLSNDIEGLGAGEEAAIFDASAGSAFEGYVWMGSLTSLDEAGPEFATEAFLHELAHRWGAYLRLDAGFPSDLLLGRNQTHWNFFADTGNSPLEGNRWTEVPPDRWTTQIDAPPAFAFSPLDLYLMGVLPPEAVSPFIVLREPVAGIEPTWFRPLFSSPPAHRIHLEVSLRPASVSTVTIDDVVRANGPRVPPARASTTPVERQIGVVLLSDGHTNPSLELLSSFDRRLQGWVAAFGEATGQRLVLRTDLHSAGSGGLGASCSALADCDRTLTDRCAATSGGGLACTRTCLEHADCSGGCCTGGEAPGLCEMRPAGGACGPEPTVPGDAGVKADLELSPDAGARPLEDPETGCGCRSSSAAPSLGTWAIWIVAVWALRSGERGCRRGARRRRHGDLEKTA